MLTSFKKAINLYTRYGLNRISYNHYSNTSFSSSQTHNNNIKFNSKNDLFKTSNNNSYQLVVGVEIHAQIKSKEKLFSDIYYKYKLPDSLNVGSLDGCIANSRVSYVDAAFPGTLPVLNAKCVEQAIKTGLSIGASINQHSYFDRKHYFYQDLPQGYQITQYHQPIVKNGSLLLNLKDGRQHNIRISHIQLEQDSGKSIHDQSSNYTLVDLNRAGIGLMEIVSEADFRSSEQVGLYVKQLQQLLRHIGTSDANMQLGEMRADINISVRPEAQEEYGTRVELKNMISIKAITGAIDAEAMRQIEILESGGRVTRETRGYDQTTGTTFHMRTKEDEVDYRFFPEPDLPPLRIEQSTIDKLATELPELPEQMLERLVTQYSIPRHEATVLVEDRRIVKYFEDVIAFGKAKNINRQPKKVMPWILKEVFEWLNSRNETIDRCPLAVQQLAELVDLVDQGYLSSRTGKEIIEKLLDEEQNKGGSVKSLVDSMGLSQISDDSTLEQLCKSIVESNPKEVADYKSGKQRVFKFFVGEIMKQTKGRSNPEKVNQYLKNYLDK
ncbi:glutamyl-tRNA amidotransferase B subunit [Heterostelium album PN500]|uniref:Glutamyl-tRNA(Gln) amidotransferase subunit B, mitochondrial n=1 Tax=Heterostelium pallidum (strain ATCC 26659 / Pp 5 / PN500) TaxID=670386 RepID=D3B508_HETP5|nr:glutamyl-tRNA amidotransferase B subunit [Heterostelium album PN500]EFA84406.1 glutamyl-tRNA amidotransferase B subunit [Heterostelium album PN500]|eukprot:XP_020436520.1 glutamyl-tRNA amidotransferase B subunit [Heterostelium album PN500]